MSQEQTEDTNNLPAGMDGNAMVGILFQVHALTTINSPLIMNKVTGDLRNIKNDVIDNGTDSVFIETIEEFKASSISFGTVHHEPAFWRGIFGKAFYDTQKIKDYIKMKKGDETITFDDYEYVIEIPNGCCTNEQCPVKKFYEIYNSHLLNN